MLTVEDYFQIRHMVLVEGKSQREVAQELGHSRKTVKKAILNSIPPGYQRTKDPDYPVLGKFIPIIDAWLEEDKAKPRKQRHTAERIFQRLKDDHGYPGHYSSVQRYVAYRLSVSGDVYFPLVFAPGEEAQVDWGEAVAILGGVETKVMLFCMRLCHSTASFVRAYRRKDMASFLDGIVRAFEYFGGVPRRGAFDNLKAAVISIGKGRDRKLTTRFKELMSHYLFQVRFCIIAAGNEKGHVENLVKHSQRTFMTPLPACSDFDALNESLEKEMRKDLDRVVTARDNKTRLELLKEEQAAMINLPVVPFEPCEMESTRIGKQALVRYDKNDYSVPTRWARHQVTVKGFIDRVELYVFGDLVASHPRCYLSGEYILNPYHYLALLEKKPGGIHNARPFQGEPFGEDLEYLRHQLEFRYGGEGTRKYVNVLLLFSEFKEEEVKAAVRKCVSLGAYSDEAVFGVLNYIPPKKSKALDLSKRPELRISCDGIRPATQYDALLRKEALV
jgi:transposase